MGYNGDAVLRATKQFLLDLADRLDGWAWQSRTGGWSTHQIAENKNAADNCRRQAAAIRQVLPREQATIFHVSSEPPTPNT